MKQNKSNLGLFAIVGLVSVIWGFSFVGTKIALEFLSTMEVLAMRWTLGAIVLVILAIAGVIKVNFRNKSLKPVLILAGLQPCIYSICECEGIDLTTASESSIIIAMVPILVLIFSAAFFHKKIDKVTTFAILLAFAGVVTTIVFSPSFSLGGKAAGYLCLFGAVTAGAVYTIYCNHVGDRYNSMEVTLVMAVVGAIWFNLLSLVMGNGFAAYAQTVSEPRLLLAILFLGLGCTAFCYFGYNTVITKLPAHQASALQCNLITVVGVFSGILVNGDSFGWFTAVGLVMIVTGIVVMNMQEAKAKA